MFAAATLAITNLAGTVIFLQLKFLMPADTLDDPGSSTVYP